MKFAFSLLIILCSFSGFSQQLDTGISTSTSAVRIFENPNIRLLTGRQTGQKNSVKKARGYRIQIFNGIDRQKAKEIQLAFMRQHPGISAYFGYDRPHFRVRVGDFTTRAAALELYHSMEKKYTCIIVPDIVNIKQ